MMWPCWFLWSPSALVPSSYIFRCLCKGCVVCKMSKCTGYRWTWESCCSFGCWRLFWSTAYWQERHSTLGLSYYYFFKISLEQESISWFQSCFLIHTLHSQLKNSRLQIFALHMESGNSRLDHFYLPLPWNGMLSQFSLGVSDYVLHTQKWRAEICTG